MAADAVTSGRALALRRTPQRAKLVFAALAVMALYLLVRLVIVQVIQSPKLAREATAEHSSIIELFARRGTITDRERVPLVRSLPSESVYAVPAEIDDPARAAALLAPLTHHSVAALEAAFRERSMFRWLGRKIPHEAADRIRKLNLPGVAIIEEETGVRYNPSGRLASTVLGFVGVDENGLDGIEYAYDDLLRGTSGKMTLETDQFGRAIPFGQSKIVEAAKPGRGLVLTLDSYLQFETERALREGAQKFHARSATAIVMDPWTGEILAMANTPDYDPANYGKASPEALRNRAVTDAYEPGSTFKLVTATAALESGRVTPASRFPAKDALTVGGATIHNAEDGFMAGQSGTESLEDIIAYSHNVGAAEVGIATGARALDAQIRRFGFGDPTRIEAPGESPGIVTPVADWSGSSLPTISFGHGIAVTPIQLIRAYAAIANGGLLLRPRLVDEITDPDGKPIYRYGREVERRVMSPKTAEVLRGYLRAVVVRGTGDPTAQVAGYTTAGKTGTAQVVENGGYAPGQYIASFVGFIPAERPRFVILVKVERPRGAIYGSLVAAPIFTQIARAAMLHAGAMPTFTHHPPAKARSAGAR